MKLQEIREYLRNHDLFVEIQEDEGRIEVLIEWGDWKHDHAYCDYLMEQISYKCID